MSTPFDHLDAIEQATHRIEALSVAAGCMAAADIDDSLITEVCTAIAEVACTIRGEINTLIESKDAT